MVPRGRGVKERKTDRRRDKQMLTQDEAKLNKAEEKSINKKVPVTVINNYFIILCHYNKLESI